MDYHANATEEASSAMKRESITHYGITIRPNENYLYTYNQKRIKYRNFCTLDQKNFLEYYLEKMKSEGLPALSAIQYEETTLPGVYNGTKLVHVHGTIGVTETELKILENFAAKLNKKYLKTKAGQKPYVEFDIRPIYYPEGWDAYITKDADPNEAPGFIARCDPDYVPQYQHPVEVWTRGI